MSHETLVSGQRRGPVQAQRAAQDAAAWARSYLRPARAADGACALAAALVPLIVRFQAGPHLCGDQVRRRLAVKPGITGLLQVNGRWDLSWDESVRGDLRYVENWSLMLDLQILRKIWPAIKRGAAAY